MGRKNKYEVTYAVMGGESVTQEVVAHDPACALGVILDDLEDNECGDCPELSFVTIRRADDGLPLAIRRAYERAATPGKNKRGNADVERPS